MSDDMRLSDRRLVEACARQAEIPIEEVELDVLAPGETVVRHEGFYARGTHALQAFEAYCEAAKSAIFWDRNGRRAGQS